MKHHEDIFTDSNGMLLLKSYYSTAELRKNQIKVHHHAECELSAILKGNGVYLVGNKRYEFGKGSVFLFSGDEEHCITDIYEQCEILNVQFVPRLLWSDDDLSLSKIFFARSENYSNKIDENNPLTITLYDTIIQIKEELIQKNPGYKAMSKYKLLYAISQIVRNYDYIDNSVSTKSLKTSIKPTEAALSYIEKNLENNLTLSEIAHVAAMSPTYFSTVFKKLNGISLWEYITAKRIWRAVELLQTTGMTKLDIAMRCGFTSSSNFYKAFTKVTGKQPSDYVNTGAGI